MSKATAEYVTARAVDLKTKSTAAFEIAVGKDPDKVRAMLNVWLVPEFKPTFYDDDGRYSKGISTTIGLEDVGLLDPSYSTAVADPGGQEGRYPIRMIDLDTKHLIDYPDIGPRSQYCILSHSWKGVEISYKYITDAKAKAFNRALAAAGANGSLSDKTHAPIDKLNDIDTIKNQCDLDITEQEKRIEKLARENNILPELGIGDSGIIVEELLSRRVKVQALERGDDGRGGLQRAKNRLAIALAARHAEAMEDDVFKQFFEDIGLDEDKAKEVMNADRDGSEQKQSDIDVANAEKTLLEENRRQSEGADNVKFFERHGHIREAVEDLIGLIQQRKSMTKVDQAIERSKEIFDTNPFPRTEKRYLWIDSCCINRADSGEYARSISAMGEWYKNAEFCLVHLDTNRGVPSDSLADWRVIKSLDPTPPSNITSYADIIAHKPEWSTRAWTLQELVMSKATFYVNSSWKLLSRPVEYLGPWYFLCPFVSLYTNIDANNPYSPALGDEKTIESLTSVLDASGIQYRLRRHDQNRDDISAAQKLIAMLEILDLRIPSDIAIDTAISQIAQSVHIVVSSLTADTGETSNGKRLLDNILRVLQPYLLNSQAYSLAERARYAINTLIRCLVSLIERPILDDRSYIADFGNLPGLDLWQKGLVRSQFSTHKAMSLVCGRDATVTTDRAYCLMGMLGVKYPTFPAEGLTKALSRLLDEVIISSNDVSVFNWTGRQYGSPVRGRSLYPFSPEAYKFGKDANRKKRKDQKLAHILQLERYEVMSDFLAISGMLLDTIMFVKEQQKQNIPLLWVKEILRVVKRTKFELLKPHITNIGKILKYVETAFDNKPSLDPPSAAKSGTPTKESAPNQTSPSFSPFSSLSSQIKTPSLPKDITPFKTPSFGRKKTEPEAAPPKSSSRGIGGFKAPSLKSFGRKDSGNSQSSQTPRSGTPINEPDAVSLPSGPPTPSLMVSDTSKHSLDEQVLSYIGSIKVVDEGIQNDGDGENKPKPSPVLPPELEKVLADIPTREFSRPEIKSEEIDTMISPNPIIIKNSGIEGLFDVQRVVVSMAQPEKLRRQIKLAVSPNQKITGWCIISTGFARVMVSFACPKYILEKELDIVQSVESKVLNGKDDEETSDDSKETNGDEAVKEKHGATLPMENVWQRTVKTINTSEPTENNTNDPEDPGLEKAKTEGARVSRMIGFVQESNLAEVAGEWVLARFSGVPGAKWFLCHLELGGTGRDFYGHRIATDEIDFHNAAPEMGLLKYWEYYMMQKKNRLCTILQKLMESRDWGNFKTEMGQNIFKRVAKETGMSGQEEGAEEDSDDEDSDAGFSDTIKDIGGMALTMAGAGLVQQFYQWRADRLQKNLAADVLKKFPTHMQTAMESLDDNKDLMPSMFHSAKTIHMF
ncbi:uncharacterized protein F4822DRAFT_263314 [Hypoxylon trugodes]|uniref:uncharacterized protein n=1 Tax=Hypoxylon trugodes TaxID=326681 RepID=UPI0021951E51|nr:uncharacterized protein F4822DRAFT_263314 [Hypoxylon trugodes]KAI1388954.1 hypothetical protein F4822DRAFT_263314 [Hypoxylon trugodes]